MRHAYFEVSNFRGIESVRFDLSSRPQTRVYTLVGLNESGKTTILQALNFFSYKGESLDSLHQSHYSVLDPHDAIPKSKRGNFNDSITIKVGYSLDENDNHRINEYLRSELDLELVEPINSFTITERYEFQNSRLVSESKHPSRTWDLLPQVKRTTLLSKRRRSQKVLTLGRGELTESWTPFMKFVTTLLPSILYFPNFLFDFPDRIYLENAPSHNELHATYKDILQDVLNAIGEGYDLDNHVLARMKSNDANDKEALRSVLTRMARHMSFTVNRSWNNILRKPSNEKEIVIEAEGNEQEGYSLVLRLREADDNYTIGERSLGFRWFFAFLLLTCYRHHRQGAAENVLFLFDEPASNLHSTAQRQLRESFGNLENCSIIYTTHSHHLINPAWLEGTYVVKNEGLDYSEEDNYLAKNTKITLHKYRDFAAQYPNQETYFQPILEVLQYRPSDLEHIPDVVMIEGKNDFYTLKYFNERVLKRNTNLNLLPGGGAGSLTEVIRLYIGWGRNFVILLDSDGTGRKERSRYVEEFGSLLEGRIFTLEDIHPQWRNKALEAIIDEADRV